MPPHGDARLGHSRDIPSTKPGLFALFTLTTVLLSCGGAEPPGHTPDAATFDLGADVSADVPTFDLSNDRTDSSRRACTTDTDCADLIDCTLDACRNGQCTHTPQSSLCPMSSICDSLQGCRARRRCTSDSQCSDTDSCSLNERCENNYCVADELAFNTPCGPTNAGTVCSAGLCQCPASRPNECDGHCVDLGSDPTRCGSCTTSCTAGSWCASGRCTCATPQLYCASVGCVDPRSDPMNCGTCGQQCTAPSRCEDGRCRAPCPTGTHRCGDICSPDSATATCGVLCTPCTAPHGATPTCIATNGTHTCDFNCPVGTHRCGPSCARDDQLATCGQRCSPCPTPALGTVACVSGACTVTCNPGAHRCGDVCVANDLVSSCGSLCTPCLTPVHGVATCTAGVCTFTCETGFHRCGDVCSDGNDPLGCGPSCMRCTAPTNGRATCVSGSCGFECNSGSHACGARCERDDQPATCGARCTPCEAPSNARATCEGGTCGWQCVDGFVRAGDHCRARPRPIWPPSGSTVANRRPRFQWTIPSDADPMAADTVVELCRERGCTTVTATLPGGAGHGAPTTDLPRGMSWWRVRAGGLTSAAWPIVIGGVTDAGSARPTAAFGAVPDFNSDGFADTVFGAPFASPPIVLLYPGARGGVGLFPPAPVNAPDGSLRFGAALSVGDLNGDGRMDLVVGAPARADTSARGAVYVFFAGEMGLGQGADATLTDPIGGTTAYGEVLTAAGDFNGDGYSDLAVGASRSNAHGAVYVYLGSASGPANTPTVTLSGSTENLALYGGSLAAGDLDADGDSDLVIGASGVGSFTGRVYVHNGTQSGLATTSSLTLDRAEGGQFGAAVAIAGDLDGDGYADLAAGAPAVDNGTGIAVVYRTGAAGVITGSAQVRHGEAPQSDFGSAIVSAGDMNNDGRFDLLVGAGRFGNFTGRAYLLRGDTTDTVGAGASAITGPMVTAAYFGGVLGAGRDIDGDGFDDVLISAERNNSFAGGAFVYYGTVTGVGRSTEIPSAIMNGRFGYALALRFRPTPRWF